MEDNKVVLSVLVISHNQVGLLSRCLDSVLRQRLNVRYEVVVSDDRSTDGTWELIESYMERYPNIVRGVKCNSDECNPINRSERCGWNKANVYNHACGEFFVNIDADDYLKSDSIYQAQLDALLANPDCSMCQQRVWQVEEGKPLESGYAWPDSRLLTDGRKMSPGFAIRNDLQGLNSTYMFRRRWHENPTKIFGKLFDDTVITLYHLQFGDIVFLDRADYVWVQYGESISNSLKGDDCLAIIALLPYQHALLIPKFSRHFIARKNLDLVRLLKKSISHKVSLKDESLRYLAQFKGFIFKYYADGQNSVAGRVRLVVILVFLLLYYRGIGNKRKCEDRIYRLLFGWNGLADVA